jgi:hypothetical protein
VLPLRDAARNVIETGPNDESSLPARMDWGNFAQNAGAIVVAGAVVGALTWGPMEPRREESPWRPFADVSSLSIDVYSKTGRPLDVRLVPFSPTRQAGRLGGVLNPL